jgi:nucleoside phosphorylase
MSSTSEPGHAPEPVDFLIVTALPEERDAILRLLEDYQQVQIDSSLVCYQSSLQAANQESPYSLAITQFSQMGNVEAGIHTARSIEALDPGYVLMVGIAAGVKRNQVALGEVLYPKTCTSR